MNFEDQRLLETFDEDVGDVGINLANQQLNTYIEEILKPLFPHYDRTSSIMSGYYPNGAELTMSTFGKVLRGSQFYYPENQSNFVHFTNIHNARNIISEGCIYLSGLNTSTDQNEIELNLKAFENHGDPWESISTDVKEDFLSLSLSPYIENKEFLNNVFSNIQNNYFQFGNDFPVGLVFEIDLSNRDDWWCYHLSEVQYSEGVNSPPKYLTNLVEQTLNWSKLNKFNIYKMPHVLYPLMAFFKEGNYKIENEVRLIKSPISSIEKSATSGPLFNGYSINSRNQLVKIEKLYFDGPRKTEVFERTFPANEYRDSRINQIPKIKLKKILLPTLKFETLSLKNTFNKLLTSLSLNVEVNYIEFNNREKIIEIF
jgi:hypothetical protein